MEGGRFQRRSAAFLFILLSLFALAHGFNVWVSDSVSTEPELSVYENDNKLNLRIFEGFSLIIDSGDGLRTFAGFKKLTKPQNDEFYLIRVMDKTSSSKIQQLKQYVTFHFQSGKYYIVSTSDPLLLDHFLFIRDREWISFFEKTDQLMGSNLVVYAGPSKNQLVNRVDGAQVNEYIKQLSGAVSVVVNGRTVSIKTRYTGGPDIDNAASFVEAFFKSCGLETMMQPFTFKSTNAQNVIGIKRGTTLPNEIVVVGAHYDSISEKPTTLAPGAVDDGSGSAAVMHLAKITADMTFDRTIHFALFSGEEQGIYGSAYYVDQAVKNKVKITNAMCMDMISYSRAYFGVTVEGTKTFQPLIDVVASNMNQYKTQSNFAVYTSTNSFGSDHVSFQKAGIPAILAIEKDDTDYPCYHKTCDTDTYVNVAQTTQIVRGIAGSLCDLAGVPLPP